MPKQKVHIANYDPHEPLWLPIATKLRAHGWSYKDIALICVLPGPQDQGPGPPHHRRRLAGPRRPPAPANLRTPEVRARAGERLKPVSVSD